MNAADAAAVSQGLAAIGLRPTPDPKEADVVVLITCVVRQKAEDRVVGRLTSFKHLGRGRPEAIIAVMGCFVDDEHALRMTYPWVHAFFKPSDTQGLLRFVRQRLAASPGPVTREAIEQPPSDAACAYVPICYGCSHHCTYCIVRLRRGKQRSRPLLEISAETQHLADLGVCEVTLLGQNVDAYGEDLGPGAPDLADVLQLVHRIASLWRIRFLTSHPADMSSKLVETVANLPRVCPHFELAVQSGDDDILKRMGRNYSAVYFRDLVSAIREQVPDCSIATDVIVGFPGETASQFQATRDLVASMRFDTVHIAKYSPRPGTPAAQLPDDVPPREKERRRASLEALQKRISRETNAALLSQTVEVLVEESRRGRWKGRTVTNKLVFFEDSADWRGRLAQVRVTHAGPWSLRGAVVR